MVPASSNSTDDKSRISLPPTGGGVIVDLGAGDGRFAYQSAKRHPDRFYIGIDAVSEPLEKISTKAMRKPAKGGLPNLLFAQATIESLPEELNGLADEVHVHFPWGSLLRAFVLPDIDALVSTRRICSPGALLEIVIGVDFERDKNEVTRLGLKPLTPDFIQGPLKEDYLRAGFEISEYGEFAPGQWPLICTSWAQRLKNGRERALLYLIARAA